MTKWYKLWYGEIPSSEAVNGTCFLEAKGLVFFLVKESTVDPEMVPFALKIKPVGHHAVTFLFGYLNPFQNEITLLDRFSDPGIARDYGKKQILYGPANTVLFLTGVEEDAPVVHQVSLEDDLVYETEALFRTEVKQVIPCFLDQMLGYNDEYYYLEKDGVFYRGGLEMSWTEMGPKEAFVCRTVCEKKAALDDLIPVLAGKKIAFIDAAQNLIYYYDTPKPVSGMHPGLCPLACVDEKGNPVSKRWEVPDTQLSRFGVPEELCDRKDEQFPGSRISKANPMIFDGTKYVWRVTDPVSGAIVYKNYGKGARAFLMEKSRDASRNPYLFSTYTATFLYWGEGEDTVRFSYLSGTGLCQMFFVNPRRPVDESPQMSFEYELPFEDEDENEIENEKQVAKESLHFALAPHSAVRDKQVSWNKVEIDQTEFAGPAPFVPRASRHSFWVVRGEEKITLEESLFGFAIREQFVAGRREDPHIVYYVGKEGCLHVRNLETEQEQLLDLPGLLFREDQNVPYVCVTDTEILYIREEEGIRRIAAKSLRDKGVTDYDAPVIEEGFAYLPFRDYEGNLCYLHEYDPKRQQMFEHDHAAVIRCSFDEIPPHVQVGEVVGFTENYLVSERSGDLYMTDVDTMESFLFSDLYPELPEYDSYPGTVDVAIDLVYYRRVD